MDHLESSGIMHGNRNRRFSNALPPSLRPPVRWTRRPAILYSSFVMTTPDTGYPTLRRRNGFPEESPTETLPKRIQDARSRRKTSTSSAQNKIQENGNPFTRCNKDIGRRAKKSDDDGFFFFFWTTYDTNICVRAPPVYIIRCDNTNNFVRSVGNRIYNIVVFWHRILIECEIKTDVDSSRTPRTSPRCGGRGVTFNVTVCELYGDVARSPFHWKSSSQE